jgi:FdhD protein
MKILSSNNGEWKEQSVDVIAEQGVTLTVNNSVWLTFMCTPLDLEALAIGFLYNEEIIQSIDDVASVRVCPGEDNIDVWLHRSAELPEKWIRTSGCSGGKTTIQQINSPAYKSKNDGMISPESIGRLMKELIEVQELYKQSGGVHMSAISDGKCILASAEDIGRHNTLDKLAGKCLLQQIAPKQNIILTTGRISSEMIQKAGRMGASLVISRTSPTTLSIKIADELGITLVGYAHRDHFNVYSHLERILTTTAIEKITREEK